MNVEEIAESQYGALSRRQARMVMSDSAIDRRIASGRWIVVHPGVFRIAGAPVSGRQRAMSASLWAGDRWAVSHTTAARLLRLDVNTDGVHITVPRSSGLRSRMVTVHHGELRTRDRVTADGIPCTSATRTLVDCAALVDGETLEAAFEQARRMGLTSVRAVGSQIGRGRRGSAQLRTVLEHAAARPRESRLEVKLSQLLRTSALPEPMVQLRIGRFRVDFAWPAYLVVCECDGFEWHSGRLAWKRDRRRIAAIEAAGGKWCT